MGSPFGERPWAGGGPGALRHWVNGLRNRWRVMPRAGRLNVGLYAFTVLSTLALVFELVVGAPDGPSGVATATPTTVEGGSVTTVRDRRPGITVAPTTTRVTVAPVTTLPVATVARPAPTLAPVRRPVVTEAPAPTAPASTEAPATTEAPSTTKPRPPVDENPGGPSTPIPPVLPSFP